MKKKMTVSVAIPSYNEEKNIGNLLDSVLSQRESCYQIIEVLVVSDGSTDSTIPVVRQFKDPRIKVISHTKRAGKATRLNEVFKSALGEVIVLLDADVFINSSNSLEKLVEPFVSDKKIAVVGGNPQPTKAITFVEEAINRTYYAYLPLRGALRNGSNPYGCDGKIMAVTKSFAKNIKLPRNMVGTDSFLYFQCVSQGRRFAFSPEATALYRSATNLRDHIRQSVRFTGAEYLQKKYFGDIVDSEYQVPRRMFLGLLAKQFFLYPIHSMFIFLTNKYCKYLALKKISKMNALWPIAKSTKESINYV